MAKDSIKKKDQLGIIAENMNSQFGLIMESFSSLEKQIKDTKKDLKEFRAETNSKFDTVFEYLSDNDNQKERLGLAEENIVIIKTKVGIDL